MDGYGWAAGPEMPASEAVRAGWSATVAALPAGGRITGKAIGRQPFEVFLRVNGVPDAVAPAEITRMPRDMELSALEAVVSAEVYWHDDRNHHVRVWLDEWQASGA